jgi:hypothetical protein
MDSLPHFDGDDSGRMPSSQEIVRQGLSAVGFLAAGAGLFVLGWFPPVVGIVAGIAACLFGVKAVRSSDKADQIGGVALFAGGALTLLSKLRIPLLGPLSHVVMSIGAVACVGLGIWNGIKFFRHLKELG